MKTRKEIYDQMFGQNVVKQRGFTEQLIMIELLMDIRELLQETKEV